MSRQLKTGYEADLRAEVERLRAEIERLKAIILGFTGKFVTRDMTRDALKEKP